jgi:hypothetical protein
MTANITSQCDHCRRRVDSTEDHCRWRRIKSIIPNQNGRRVTPRCRRRHTHTHCTMVDNSITMEAQQQQQGNYALTMAKDHCRYLRGRLPLLTTQANDARGPLSITYNKQCKKGHILSNYLSGTEFMRLGVKTSIDRSHELMQSFTRGTALIIPHRLQGLSISMG